jgi:hypothetical protein
MANSEAIVRPGGLRRFWRGLMTRGHGADASLADSGQPTPAAEWLIERSRDFFSSQQAGGPHSPTARTLPDIRYFDLAGMQRVVSILPYGKGGGLLLASYLDGHDDLISLPAYLSCASYQFFDRYQSLSLREKLLCYPFLDEGHFNSFFNSEHSVKGADYLAAVNAACEVYGDRPAEFLESRAVFFRLLYVVYSVALGRLPATTCPLIVFEQHTRSEVMARYLKEDFAEYRFIHTIRDPITNCGRTFEYSFRDEGIRGAVYAIVSLILGDAPHLGMKSRTLAVRFEDLHVRLQETMQSLADWLGLPHRPSLLESTFSGRPWTVTQGTTTWSGARPSQAVRNCRYSSVTDRCLFFAVQYENFSEWNYPCPRIFRHALVRVVTCLLFLLIPMRIEMITARSVFSADVRAVGRGVLRLCIGRVQIMMLLAVELYRRLTRGVVLLPVSTLAGPAERPSARTNSELSAEKQVL